jgi:hypothetical protein
VWDFFQGFWECIHRHFLAERRLKPRYGISKHKNVHKLLHTRILQRKRNHLDSDVSLPSSFVRFLIYDTGIGFLVRGAQPANNPSHLPRQLGFSGRISLIDQSNLATDFLQQPEGNTLRNNRRGNRMIDRDRMVMFLSRPRL